MKGFFLVFPNNYSYCFIKQSTSQVENTGMVRIGEYSPLNPNNAGRRPSIGIGEYGEERRTLMVDRRKHEYNEYLKQVNFLFF